MKLFGLTGGIGSGKSTVAAIFSTLGIPVYQSDYRAKELMTHPDLQKQIKNLLGEEAYHADATLNRGWIASRVFTDAILLDQLNSIVHPAVYQDLLNWSKQENQVKAPYLIQESAILFEENLTARLTGAILVVADKETRIARVMQRDNVTRESVLKRIENQWDDARKIPMSDYVIFNDNDRSLIQQVKDIDAAIRSTLTAG